MYTIYMEQGEHDKKTLDYFGGCSGCGSSIQNLKKNYEGDFKDGLAVFDDEVKEAREEIVAWLQSALQ